jgi:hypothetical protein
MGTIGTIIMVPPILLSFPIVRNNFYNLFYFSHLLLHVGIVFLWLHAGSDLYYMLPAIGLYATDILLRLIARFSPQRVLRVIPTSGGLVRIDFDIRCGTAQSILYYLWRRRLQMFYHSPSLSLLKKQAILSFHFLLPLPVLLFSHSNTCSSVCELSPVTNCVCFASFLVWV